MLPIHRFTSIDSTNVKAMQLASDGACNGTMVTADNQTKGRGRLGKDWLSSAGKGLYCSLIVRPQIDLLEYPKITLVAGLSVAIFLENLIGETVQLKWPNDIYIGGRKCGGLLTESSFSGNIEDRYAVIGIGLNINNLLTDFPIALRTKATSLFLQSETIFDISSLYEGVRFSVMAEILRFESEGFKDILDEWRKRDFLKGKRTQWVSINREVIVGTSLGVDRAGLLYVQDDEGKRHEVLSGDVQLAKKVKRQI